MASDSAPNALELGMVFGFPAWAWSDVVDQAMG